MWHQQQQELQRQQYCRDIGYALLQQQLQHQDVGGTLSSNSQQQLQRQSVLDAPPAMSAPPAHICSLNLNPNLKASVNPKEYITMAREMQNARHDWSGSGVEIRNEESSARGGGGTEEWGGAYSMRDVRGGRSEGRNKHRDGADDESNGRCDDDDRGEGGGGRNDDGNGGVNSGVDKRVHGAINSGVENRVHSGLNGGGIYSRTYEGSYGSSADGGAGDSLRGNFSSAPSTTCEFTIRSIL